MMFAWSISFPSYRWVDYCFVFYTFAVVLAFSTALARHTLAADIFHDRSPAEHVGEAKEDEGGAMKVVADRRSLHGFRRAGDAEVI